MKKADLLKLSKTRLKESKVLLDNKHFAGAYYLAGYAIECALKACIAKKINRHEIPAKKLINDVYSHDLESLMGLAGLRNALQVAIANNPQLGVSWAVVKDWSVDVRYALNIPDTKSKDLYSAITRRKHGVLVWVRKHA